MSDDLEDRQNDGSFEAGDTDTEFEDESLSLESVEDWGGGELEAAYLKALSALEASDLEMAPPPGLVKNPDPGDAVVTHSDSFPEVESSQPGAITESQTDSPPEAVAFEPTEMMDADLEVEQYPPAHQVVQSVSAAEVPPSPRQIIEACLCVGGTALTSKRLSGILRGTIDNDFVEREIDLLNRLYAAENRPYEIRMGEGGFRLVLREEFERIRHKVYGLGPKEVRLSQEALEVLAVVAYHQPIKQAKVEEIGKPGCGAVLRQLVRRELIAVERDPAHPREVHYKTTPRFLSLFDIRSLDELPRHEQVSYK